MRVLICGDRHWKDGHAVKRELLKLEGVRCVIEGEASGADIFGRVAAESLGIQVKPFPALWNLYGKAAGHVRNRQMLVEGKPDLVLAFHSNIEKSKGTKNMVEQARKAGVPVKIFKR
jgi:hypothetical protein